MPKVLVFKETLLPASETFILAQMRALKNYEAVLVGLERAHPSLPLPDAALLLSRQYSPISDARSKLYRRTGTAPLFHARAKRTRPDLIHAHFASGGRTVLPLARRLGVPLVVTLHGKDVTVRMQEKGRYRRLAEEASIFICVSNFIRDRAIEAGFPAQKLLVHYIGIDRKVFSPARLAGVGQGVLFVGRLVEKKGCAYLIRAMELVQKKHPECMLTIIGDGPMRASLEALAGELSVRCRFLGTQFEATVQQALRDTRVFCVPSVTAADGDSEGLGMVFAEAQATGIPVVSTLHGGVPETVIDAVTGFLTPERDHRALADRLSFLVANDALWDQFRNAALRHIERDFDLITQTALLETIYDCVIGADASAGLSKVS